MIRNKDQIHESQEKRKNVGKPGITKTAHKENERKQVLTRSKKWER
jgi:hypothetical protein